MSVGFRHACFAFAIALALHADVVAQHGTEHEILLGSELAQRACGYHAYGIEALLAPEVEVQTVVAYGLYDVRYVLPFQALYGKFFVFLVECEEHHAAYTFLVFIDVVHENLHVYW